MKLTIILSFVAAATAIPGLSSLQTWLASFQQPILNLIDNPRRTSTIPQFILDTNHPWILANQRKLEGLPNSEAFLCQDLDLNRHPESQASGADLEVPANLFDNLVIDNNRAGTSRPGWPNAIERLTEINRCPRALANAKSLHVDVYVHCDSYSDLWLRALEPCHPPQEVAILFSDVLGSMTSLQHLYWGIPQGDAHFFEESFKCRNLSMPSVTSLKPGPLSQYLVGICPHLEELEDGSGYGWYDYSLAPGLKRFAMYGAHEGWSPSMASEVVKSMPQLESLRLDGSLGRDRNEEKTSDLKEITTILSALENLTHIDLPHSSGLGLGFDGGAWCGNAYYGKSGRAYGRSVLRQGAEITELAADIVMANLPQLKSFTIGGMAPNVTRAENGTVSLVWPWTGRMREWLLEVEPEVEDFEDVEYGGMGGVDFDGVEG
ncbi:hypothetical protein BKA64DRAFT_687946 [Cadophora sp. MPI-SDFR-AT-0126]|nr:hypothetical protein BKA64DRAFT_687946 [Leotiomycetes sp. MPI-SDFR-AT-0126]